MVLASAVTMLTEVCDKNRVPPSGSGLVGRPGWPSGTRLDGVRLGGGMVTLQLPLTQVTGSGSGSGCAVCGLTIQC